MSTRFKVCSCNRSMPLDAAAGEKLGQALGGGPLPVATELCRHQVGAFLDAADGVDQVVVACTQERALFSELAQQRNSAAPLRFVNLRESGGWSRDGKAALPKMAALLAAAALPQPEPVPSVSYESGGHVLIVGPAERALPWARRLLPQLEVSVLLSAGGGGEMLEERDFPCFSGADMELEGWLGGFTARWHQANPIDLELCTRCNACVSLCPEQAIDLTYQVDLAKCRAHRDCVKACGAVGAIDFLREEVRRELQCDLVFDLGDQPLIRLHQPPQGYFAPGADPLRQGADALRLVQMVGQFEKPKYFLYKEQLCAHSRNEIQGCNACVEICSTAAIAGDGNGIKVTPQLCMGCGACTTVCPSGALGYAWPRASDLGRRIQVMLAAYREAGGEQPALLLHAEEEGAQLIARLGRLARAGAGLAGVPARVLPLGLHHVAAAGIDLWLAALSYGASHVALLCSGSEAPQYLQALRQQLDYAQAIMSGLGYQGRHFSLLQADSPRALDAALGALPAAQGPRAAAAFRVAADKRNTLDLVFEHLARQAPEAAPAQPIPLPAGAPYGALAVDRERCTLCMACIGACPEAALLDNADAPQLRFIERNCVQCGLCQKTCPEQAITLLPRLLLGPEARQPALLNEAEPFCCVRCGKPFGTRQMVENMLGRLAGHGAFAGKLERLKMCSDCRVVDMMSNRDETVITEIKR